MSTKNLEKLVREVKAKMNVKDFEKLVRDVREGKIGIEDCLKLNKDGKRDEARALMAALAEEAENAPDEFITETGRPAVFKRRGRLVVQDEEGNWKLKNPPRRKKKGRSKQP